MSLKMISEGEMSIGSLFDKYFIDPRELLEMLCVDFDNYIMRVDSIEFVSIRVALIMLLPFMSFFAFIFYVAYV